MGTVAAPWKQLILQALEGHSHLRHSTYIQLATVGLNGRPANRTVVFRGFQETSDKILINTDARSRKIEELKHCPYAEICWYFTESWEQFRVNGRIEVVDGSNSVPAKLEIREKSWFSCSMNSRLQYLGPTPGLPCLSEQPRELSLDPSTGPVGAFCLLILDPEQVDYLNLKSNHRLMFTSRLSDNGEKCWTSDFTYLFDVKPSKPDLWVCINLPCKASCLNEYPISMHDESWRMKKINWETQEGHVSFQNEVMEYSFEQEAFQWEEQEKFSLGFREEND